MFFLFCNNEVVWKFNQEKAKAISAKDAKNEKVSYLDPGFVSSKDQHKLTYKNPEDDISGRFLYDQEDVSDDYQVHVIYLLAKDSKDKKLDVKGKIEKIILKGNKHLKKRINKQFRYDIH